MSAFGMLARRHDTSAVQLVERPQIAMAGPLGIKTSGSNLTLAARSEVARGQDRLSRLDRSERPAWGSKPVKLMGFSPLDEHAEVLVE